MPVLQPLDTCAFGRSVFSHPKDFLWVEDCCFATKYDLIVNCKRSVQTGYDSVTLFLENSWEQLYQAIQIYHCFLVIFYWREETIYVALKRNSLAHNKTM